MRFWKLPTVTLGSNVGVLPYPVQEFRSKRLLKDAILKGELDIEFVVGYSVFGRPLTRKVTEMKVGEVIPFQGPGRLNPRYYGRLVRTLPLTVVKGIEIE